MHYTSREVYEQIFQQTNDPIVERKTCRVSSQPFPIYQKDLDFYDKVSPSFAGKKYPIPTPTLCPEERQRRRLMFRNERKLYKRKCDFSGKPVVSMYAPDSPYTVYDQKIWRSDKWDPRDYGREFDFSKTFAEQFQELMLVVPRIAVMAWFNENSDYVNACGNSKNCYLIFDSDFCEDSMHSAIVKHSKNVVDGLHIYHCENIYNSINCTNSFNLINCYECDNASYLRNCSKCTNCTHCYNCSNLVNSNYCIDNEQYSKEDYQKKVAEIGFSYHYPSSLDRNQYTIEDDGSVWNNLYKTKNCVFCHNIGSAEDLRYCDLVSNARDCADISSFGENIEQCYYTTSVGVNSSRVFFTSVAVGDISDVYYSDYLTSGCKHCFGCSHMHGNKQYCIFNKQYSKEEYEQLVPKIIEHMQTTGERGEFFPPSLSAFAYNESVAQEYFPLSKKVALEQWYKRQDKEYPINIPDGTDTVNAADLNRYEEWLESSPVRGDAWNEVEGGGVSDAILSKAIICETSGRPFRIIKPELAFYRKHKLPLPRKHPDIRHQERIAQRPGRTLYLRQCDKCHEQILSVYPPDYNGKVYCEKDYQQEVFG